MLELLQGCRSMAERAQIQERLEALHWLATEGHHWRMAGLMAFDLRRAGVTAGAVDALIAVLAQSYGCSLLHQDSDFGHISRHTGLRLLQLE